MSSCWLLIAVLYCTLRVPFFLLRCISCSEIFFFFQWRIIALAMRNNSSDTLLSLKIKGKCYTYGNDVWRFGWRECMWLRRLKNRAFIRGKESIHWRSRDPVALYSHWNRSIGKYSDFLLHIINYRILWFEFYRLEEGYFSC